MRKVKFLGAAGGVTGSSTLLIGDIDTLLIDLGMFQGIDDKEGVNTAPLQFNVNDIRAVLITHAHLDHCGRLPLLVKSGYKGKIYTTEATKAIVHISLLDSAGLAGENGIPLYTQKDVERLISLIETVNYGLPFNTGEFTITFRNAGHILGSASIEIKDKNQQTIVFSGDLGNTPEDLIPPTEYISKGDFVVMESTYGDSTHPNENPSEIIQKEINTVETTNAALLIPAFSIERTQEIIHIIGTLKKENKVRNNTPVFLDSPLATEVTEIFKKFPELYNTELSRENSPFNFPGLTVIQSMKESKDILEVQGPKVIIAGSGMMTGGRILHHLQNYISIPSTRLLIVGYQSIETLGREIQDGAKEILINNELIPVKATITSMDSLSSHADQPKLLAWLKHIQGVKTVFIDHGDENQRLMLADKIKSEIGIHDVILPNINQEYDLKVTS